MLISSLVFHCGIFAFFFCLSVSVIVLLTSQQDTVCAKLQWHLLGSLNIRESCQGLLVAHKNKSASFFSHSLFSSDVILKNPAQKL